jgi:hypothetical protein
VLDASTPPIWPDTSTRPPKLVVNKVDLPAVWNLTDPGDAVQVSALSSTGLDELCRRLADWLVPDPPPPGTPVPFTPDLCDLIDEACSHVASHRIAEAAKILKGVRQVVGTSNPNDIGPALD